MTRCKGPDQTGQALRCIEDLLDPMARAHQQVGRMLTELADVEDQVKFGNATRVTT